MTLRRNSPTIEERRRGLIPGRRFWSKHLYWSPIYSDPSTTPAREFLGYRGAPRAVIIGRSLKMVCCDDCNVRITPWALRGVGDHLQLCVDCITTDRPRDELRRESVDCGVSPLAA